MVDGNLNFEDVEIDNISAKFDVDDSCTTAEITMDTSLKSTPSVNKDSTSLSNADYLADTVFVFYE